jgi:phenylacetate-coenzyme A ligase PaaK-like adenylate-forming protein
MSFDLKLTSRLLYGEQLLNLWLRIPYGVDRIDIIRDIAKFWQDTQEQFHRASDSMRRSYQAKILNRLLSICSTSKVYREIWKYTPRDGGFNELVKLPVITKENIASFWPFGTKPTLLSWDQVLQEEATSGVTSPPLQFYSDRRAFPRIIGGFFELLSRYNVDITRDIITISPPYRYIFPASPNQTVRFIPLTEMLKNRRYYDISQYLRKWEADVLIGYPSDLVALVDMMTELEIPPSKTRVFKVIFFFGEGITSAERRKISLFFKAPVIGFYELVEFGIVGIECAPESGYHVDESSHIVEILDQEGNPVESGVGRIVITSFLNMVTPFIRYDTGDLGLLETGVCSKCGRASSRLYVIGRAQDRGEFLSSEDDVHELVEKLGIGLCQFYALPNQQVECKILEQEYLSRKTADERDNAIRRFSILFPSIKVSKTQELLRVLRGKAPRVIRRPNMSIHLW